MEPIDLALTFDDILLVPAKSEVLPRDADLKTRFTRNLTINIPLLSAAMDTVTGARGAICLAQAGGVGVIHRNSIARLYGESGQEMLDLMVKNPTVAIPVVVERLRQKDKEWRIVRERLNRQWKDLVEHNYYKSNITK